MYIAIDFDGTMVKHEYPRIGEDIGAVPVILALQKRGFKIILFTMRSGPQLTEAIKWCQDNKILLHGVNTNHNQHTWTTSLKPYAHVYIDDASLGAPLIHPRQGRSYIDWVAVAKYFNIPTQELNKETE